MKKTKYLVAALLLMGATTTFTSCIDNDEPAGITELRGAKAELIRAKAAVELANEAFVRAQVAHQELMNQQQEITNKQEALILAQKEAVNDLEIAKLKAELEAQIEQHKATLLDNQAATLNAQKRFEEAQKALELARVTLTPEQQLTLTNYENALNTTRTGYTNAQTALENAIKNYENALLGYQDITKEQLEVDVAAAQVGVNTSKDLLEKAEKALADGESKNELWEPELKKYKDLLAKADTALAKKAAETELLKAGPLGIDKEVKAEAKRLADRTKGEKDGEWNQALTGDPSTGLPIEEYAYKNEDFSFPYEKGSNMERLVGAYSELSDRTDWEKPDQLYIAGTDEMYSQYDATVLTDPNAKLNPTAPTDNKNNWTFYNQLTAFLKDVTKLAPYASAAENKVYYDEQLVTPTKNVEDAKKAFEEAKKVYDAALKAYNEKTEGDKIVEQAALEEATTKAYGTAFNQNGKNFRATPPTETEIANYKENETAIAANWADAGKLGAIWAAEKVLEPIALLQSEAEEITALRTAIETEIAAAEKRYAPVTEKLVALEKEVEEAEKAVKEADKAVEEAEKAYDQEVQKIADKYQLDTKTQPIYRDAVTYIKGQMKDVAGIASLQTAVNIAKDNLITAEKALAKAEKNLADFEAGNYSSQRYMESLKEEIEYQKTVVERAKAKYNKAVEDLQKVMEILAPQA